MAAADIVLVWHYYGQIKTRIIGDSIRYIEEHITEDISVDEIAKADKHFLMWIIDDKLHIPYNSDKAACIAAGWDIWSDENAVGIRNSKGVQVDE